MALSPLIRRRLTPAEQEALENPDPSDELRKIRALHEDLARRHAPIFVQSVERYVAPRKTHRPWRDFIVPIDFDAAWDGQQWKPRWLDATEFQNESALQRKTEALWSLEDPDFMRTERPGSEGLLELTPGRPGLEPLRLDLRPTVYFAVLTHSRFVVCHYVVYHTDSVFQEGSELPGSQGTHPGDLEGATVIVDAASERVVALLTVYHNEVRQETYSDPWQMRYWASFLESHLAYEDVSPVDEYDEEWAITPIRDDSYWSYRPRRHCYVTVESGTHAQLPYDGRPHGASIVYYLDRDDAVRRPPLEPVDFSHDKRHFPFVPYRLVYIGSRPRLNPDRPTLWGAYHAVERLAEGMNPPWQWAASNHADFDDPWWPNPIAFAFHSGIRARHYTCNPYA